MKIQRKHYEIQTVFNGKTHILNHEALTWTPDYNVGVNPQDHKLLDFESTARVLLDLISKEKSNPHESMDVYIVKITENYKWNEEDKCYDITDKIENHIDSVKIN